MNLAVLKLSLVHDKMTLIGYEVLSAKSYLLGLLGVTFNEGLAIGFDPETESVRGVGGGIPFAKILVFSDCD